MNKRKQDATKRQELGNLLMNHWAEDAPFGKFLGALTPDQRQLIDSMPLQAVDPESDRLELALVFPKRRPARTCAPSRIRAAA
jgi:hypothetical protein